jgi:hypothetical protein
LLAALLNYSTTLKMEAIRSSETSGTTQRTIRRHIPEEDTLHFIFVYQIVRLLPLTVSYGMGAEVIAIIIYSLVIHLETACGETKIARNLA